MSKQSERDGDPEHLEFVRQLPCCAPSVTECQSPPPQHAHHSTGAGMGVKSSDRDTIPLCWMHHRAFHDGSGPFEGWSREERERWQEEQVERALQAHALFVGADIKETK